MGTQNDERLPNHLFRQARGRLRTPAGTVPSRREIADLVNVYLYDTDHSEPFIDRNYVGKIESGRIRWPSLIRRAAFRHVLGVRTDADIGFSTGEYGADAPLPVPALVALGGEQDAGSVVRQAPVADVGAGAAWWALHDALRGHTVGHRGLALLESECARLDDVYVEVSAGELLPRVRDLLNQVVRFLGWPQPVAHRRRLCAVAGWLAGLRGWLMFDLADHRSAEYWYDLAVDAAREAEDLSLSGWLYGARSLIPTHRGDHHRAVAFARTGRSMCSPMVDASVHAWLACIEARAHAGLGDTAGMRGCLDQAATHAVSSRVAQRRHGMDFHDGILDVTYYQGTSFLLANQPAAAVQPLTTSLGFLPTSRPKARAVLTLCLAEAAVRRHHLDEATDLARQALTEARDQPILPILDRAHDVRDQIHTRGFTLTAPLDEQLAAFGTDLRQITLSAAAP